MCFVLICGLLYQALGLCVLIPPWEWLWEDNVSESLLTIMTVATLAAQSFRMMWCISFLVSSKLRVGL